ncbi:MAG TPA: right-handed parallel beta-helix repeat-containing protein [Chitinivibrionales bacterium]|nr:right-handed parallel beta-helix repeat-containing protein [Chitinivibrionales bacterium]
MNTGTYPKDDPKYLWVIPSDENDGQGTFDRPFGRIAAALAKVKPGQVIVLKAGTYPGDVTVERSGIFDKPIYLVADKSAAVVVAAACWYFYDACDFIVSGITFKDSPLGSLALTGACERNRFEHLSFIDCGSRQKASCTMFFGGAGASCNMVEFCNFERSLQLSGNAGKKPDDIVVGLMISEGDSREGQPITNHVVRRNRFTNYDYGVLIGAEDATARQYGHIISFNTIENCGREGIMVKCGDTQVKGNVLTRCLCHSISVVTGEGSVVEDNRIVDCGIGIRVAGKGHTVVNNCIVRSSNEAICVMEKNGADGVASQNIFIEQNTCALWSQKAQPSLPAISIASGSSAIIKKNLFWGAGDPYRFTGAGNNKEKHLIFDNISTYGSTAPDGVTAGRFKLGSQEQDNFDNDSGYGASGWMCRPEPYDPDKEILNESLCGQSNTPNEMEYLEKDDERGNETGISGALLKSMFFSEDESRRNSSL